MRKQFATLAPLREEVDVELKPTPQGKTSNLCNRLADLAVEQKLHHPQTLTPMLGFDGTVTSQHDGPA
jgi:hypothetical protein